MFISIKKERVFSLHKNTILFKEKERDVKLVFKLFYKANEIYKAYVETAEGKFPKNLPAANKNLSNQPKTDAKNGAVPTNKSSGRCF